MPTRLANSSKKRQKEALEHSFISALETITDLPLGKIKKLAKKFRDRTASEIARQEQSDPEIIIRPKNKSRIEFEIQSKNCTRSVREIVEDYLDRQDIGGEWQIKRKKEKGSALTVTATRNRATGSRSVAAGGSGSSSSSSEASELKEKLSNLDEEDKETIANFLKD